MQASSGNIWTLTVGALQTSLRNDFKMNDKEFFLALGWLAREENIVFYEKDGVEFIYIDY